MKRFIPKFPLLILTFLFAVSAVAQVDTAFWFAVPHITHSHAGRPIKLCVSSLSSPATVTVSQPARNATVTTFTVPANSSYTYQLVGTSVSDLTNYECNPNETTNYGIYIRSTAAVNAYISVQNNNSEIYALKGKNAYGTQFLVPMQAQFPNASSYSDAYNSVEIIGTQNNTSVTITPSINLLGGAHNANVPYTVTLNRGQVYSFASSSQAGSGHLDRTTITSDKPIVVDVSDDSATPNGNNQDLVADQLVPEELAGTEYIVVPSPAAANNMVSGSLSDYLFVYPLQDGTDVTIYSSTSATGSPLNQTSYTALNRGTRTSYHFTNNNPVFVYATKPVLVFQVTGAGNEVGGTLLPHIYCTGSTMASYKPEPSVNGSGHTKHIFLTLICNSAYTNGFQINGSSTYLTASDWQNVPGHTFKYCRKEITALNTATSIRITNSLGKFHLGVIDYHQTSGGYDDCSISYFSDYSTSSSLKWMASSMPTEYCQGDTITFQFDTVNVGNLRVEGPDSILVNQPPYCQYNAMPSQSGWYTVYGNDSRGCLVETLSDSIFLTVHPSQSTELRDTICPNVEYARFGFHFTADQTATPGIVTDSLRYETAAHGCDSIVKMLLMVREPHSSEFTVNACNEYMWNGRRYISSGDFEQTFTDVHTCDSTVTMHLTIVEPEVQVSLANDQFCENGSTMVMAVGNLPEYEWNTGETTQNIVAEAPGTYTVTVTDGDCEASASVTIPQCGFNLYLPNAITPSKKDGLNDFFCLPEYVQKFIDEFEIRIYNRWGEQVFVSQDKSFQWGGERTDRATNVYKYIIRMTNYDGRPFLYEGEIVVL